MATGGNFSCPSGTGPVVDSELRILCDADGTEFLRRYDIDGGVVTAVDTELDGQTSFTPAEPVGVCVTDESPAEPCTRCETQVLCDDGAAATIQGTTAGGTLPNGVTWNSRGAGGPEAASTDNADGAWWPAVYRFPNPTIGDATWEFDRPVVVEFSVYMRWFDFSDPADLNATQLPPGVEVVNLPDGYHYDPATRQVSVDDSRGDPGGEDCANLLDPSRAESARFRTTTAVTSVVTRYLGARVAACGQFGLQRVGAFDVTPNSVFLRTICRDCGGEVTSVVDTELDGVTAYTVAGEVGPCYPPPETPETPCVGGVQTLRLCDLDPAAPPDSQGRVCATPFLRHLVYACDGTLAQVRDTALDGTTAYSPVQVVDCHTTIPGVVELDWPLTAIDDDPDGDPGQDYVYTLTNPVTGESAEVRLQAGRVAGPPGCTWTGPPSPTNPPIFNNPTSYRYTLDDAARAMSRFRLDFLDLDTFEGVRNLNPIPDQVVFVQGDGVWDSRNIDATVPNSVVQAFWNQPPETITHSYANTGGGNACHSAVLAGITLVPDGCCTCGPDESPGSPAEPPCRDTSTLLVCDVPTDGEPTPVVTDTDPTPFEDPCPGCIPHCGGGGCEPVPNAATLWAGGTVQFGPDPQGTEGNGRVHRIAAATIQADQPGCDNGTATVSVSVRVTNDGPAPGHSGVGGLLIVDTVTDSVVGEVRVQGNPPVGHQETLSLTAQVDAAKLDAGSYVAVVNLETYDSTGSKAWTVDQFAADVVFDQTGCAEQILANVVTDCETGQVESVTYTDLSGAPYTPTGEVGQCVPATPAAEPCGDTEVITLCDLGDRSPGSPGESPGEPATFLRRLTFDCDGQIVSTEDLTLSGAPYTPLGEVGVCGPTGEVEPCRNTSSLLVCDIPNDGVEGEPTATDTDPTPYPFDDSPVRCVNPLPGGAQTLWDGGSVVVPVTTTGCHTAQVLVGAAATLQAAQPACDDGTVEIAVSVRITNDGPNPTAGNYAGGFRLHRTDTGERLGNQSIIGVVAVGESRTLSVTRTIPAALLSAGQLVSVFDVESSEALGNNNPGSQWTVDQFTAEFVYGIDGCETQVLANVVTDCETGAVISVGYTDLDGNPYTPTGEIGQCQPVTPSEQPCQDCETIPLCDFGDDSPGESPGGAAPVPFLRTICRNCDGQIASVADTALDGGDYAASANVGVCSPVGAAEPCRNTNTLLVCDVEDQGQVSGDLAATAVADASPFNAWRGYGVPADTWCQENGNPGTLFGGGSTTLGPGTVCPVGGGTHEVIAATIDDPAIDCADVTVTTSVRVTNNGPAAGYQNDGRIALWNTATQTRLAFAAPDPSAPVGHVQTVTVSATVSGADLAAGAIAFSVDLEVEHQGAKAWTVDEFTASYAGTCIVTTQFLRNVTVDCQTGQVVATVDTDLNGDPYTPAGEVGGCETGGGQCCPPEPCRNSSTLLVCDIPADGVEGDAVATDTDPTPYPWDSAPARCVNPLPGGGAALWAGGTLNFPQDTSGAGSCHPAQVLRGVAATLQAAAPACDDGTVTVDVSVRVTNNGPNPGLAYDGSLRVHRTDTGARLALDNVVRNAPAGHVQTLAVSTTVPAGLLASGQLVAVLDLETFHTDPKSWTADQFSATYTYGIDGCETQILANVVTDCDTGQIVSTTYTTIDGQPYTPTGEIGQCVPTAPAAEPCHDCETITLCDLSDPSPGSPAESPGDLEATPFLRTICRDCQGLITGVEDTTLEGDPYTVTGQVGLCGPTDGEPCRNTSTLLVCDLPTDGEPDPAVTDTDPTPYHPLPGTEPVAGGAAVLWSGGTLNIPPDTGPAPDGHNQHLRSFAATVQAPRPGCDTGMATVTASIQVERTGPDDGCGGNGQFNLFVGTTQVDAQGVTPRSTPVGTVRTLEVSAQVPAADLASGDIAVFGQFETYQLAPGSCPGGSNPDGARIGGWTVDEFEITTVYDQAGCDTQVFANVVTDCESGQVESVTYTDLSGAPYEPTGEIGECQPVTPEPCQVASTFEKCRCDDLTDESPGEIVCYQEVWAVDCQGQVSLIHTYRDDPGTPYEPQNPVPCDSLATEGEPIVGVQALRIQLNPGDSWDIATEPLAQSVTATAINGEGEITDEAGTTTLHAGETASWSVVKESDLTLRGPLVIAATTGTVTINVTRAVT